MDELEIVRKVTKLLYAYVHDAHCKALKKNKIRHKDMTILDAILRMGNHVKMNDISAFFQISPAAVSQVMKHLEEKEWIQRITEEQDKRSVYICVTEQGRKVLVDQQKKMKEKLVRFIDMLGEEDAQAFVRILEKSLKFYQENKGGEDDI